MNRSESKPSIQTSGRNSQNTNLQETSHLTVIESMQNDQTSIKKTKITIFSQAYPSFSEGEPFYQIIKQPDSNDNSVGQKKRILKPQIKSQIHQKLLQINFTPQSHTQPIIIRQFEMNDLKQLRNLQDEWFPIRYTDEFYKKIIRKQCYCLVAETVIKLSAKINHDSFQTTLTQQKILIGAAVFQLTDSQGYAYKSWSDSFLSWFRTSEDSIYIMTLGVIDEFRKKGVGKLLIESILEVVNQQKAVKLVYLHVISYNKAAINFYKKNGFIMLENLQNFYHVGGKQFGGQVYGTFVNGGKNNGKWSQWLRKLLN